MSTAPDIGPSMAADEQRAANRRTGLLLAAVAVAFFVGVMLKYWLLNNT